MASKIFTGFRALGFTSNHVPLAVRYHKKHKENYVVTCVGKAFHTYNCSKLGIVSVSDVQSEDLGCLAVDAYLVFAAVDKEVHAFSRGRKVIHSYHGHQHPVHLLLPFGQHLISVDTSSMLKIWDIQAEELYLELEFDNNTFKISCMIHPNTYMNKILVASEQGAFQLWNVRSGKLLYTFKGWKSAVTALQQAPAQDVVAVGLEDGRIILHNIKYDEILMTFKQEWGPISSISFRTDGHPIMVTGSQLGHIALWNLEEHKLQSQILEAHNGGITGMQCLPSEPLMVTSSPDNSLKVWIFDQPDGGGRLLRQRSGHGQPPNKIRHHGNNGQNILSAGQDSTMRSFSIIHDRHNKNLGRASFNKAETKKSGLKRDQHMMPMVTDFASESSRESDWDGIVACHRGLCQVTTWNYQRSTMGKHRLKVPQLDKQRDTAQCVSVSSCGNFALVGYMSGHLEKYNLQSGLHRGSFGKGTAHAGCVRGVAIDALNQVAISGGADCCVKFWKFAKCLPLSCVEFDAQVAKLVLHRESGMLAVTLDDYSVHVLDIDSRKVVRKLPGHHSSVNDMAFSPDGRWLLIASMDNSVKVWDLPSSSLLDVFLAWSPIVSLSLSPTGDFLATCHVDDLGVYLWANKTLYAHVDLRPLPADYEPQVMETPSTSHRSQGALEEEEEEAAKAYDEAEFKSPDQISEELVTLSTLPNSRWQNLLQLDVIKQRNKPKQPPKAPKAAPFFLPTVAGLEFKFDVPEEKEEKPKSHVFKSQLQFLSDFGRCVMDTKDGTKSHDDVMKLLQAMGPSAIDQEIRGLAPDGGGSSELLALFLQVIREALDTNRDFELAQAYLGLVLKLHGDFIASEPSLVSCLKELESSQLEAWTRLQYKLLQTAGLVNYIRNAAL